VLLNFGASGALLQQMAKGAPVDVFASADQETMDAAAAGPGARPTGRILCATRWW
jgi:ABC-type molybdate transport system substrate-binding protein